jgi:6-phosphogluconolactonase
VTSERRVLVHPDAESLAGTVAARVITKLIDVIEQEGDAALLLTGGTMAMSVLEAIRRSPARDSVDWSTVSFWWTDERWVPADSEERNERQAREALLDHIRIDEEKVHAFLASDQAKDMEAAAEAYAAELAAHSPHNALGPRFDITFLGVGGDGHVAALFPNTAGILEKSRRVVAVHNAPKPPPERLSLTLPVLNSSQRIFVVLGGPDKAAVLGLALAGASVEEVPLSGVLGVRRTVLFVDSEAAAQVPENLIAPQSYWTSADSVDAH